MTLSLGAEFFGLDITPGFGMVQMFQLLVGITALHASTVFVHQCVCGKKRHALFRQTLACVWRPRGLVFSYVTGLSDLIRIGTHVEPQFERPFVGPLQLGGLALSRLGHHFVGLALYYTSRGSRQKVIDGIYS